MRRKNLWKKEVKRVAEDHSTHIVTRGWYELDKETLQITDYMSGGVVRKEEKIKWSA